MTIDIKLGTGVSYKGDGLVRRVGEDPRQGGLRRAEAGADAIAFPPPPKPRPRVVMAKKVPGSDLTALARGWRDGDTARCGLCPMGTCIAAANMCMLVLPVPEGLDDEELAMFDSAGLKRVE